MDELFMGAAISALGFALGFALGSVLWLAVTKCGGAGMVAIPSSQTTFKRIRRPTTLTSGRPPVTDCLHLEFEAHVDVSRLTKVEGGPATGYTADVMIRCKKCHVPFRFLGLRRGSGLNYPTVSIEGEELRAPIEPAPGAPSWEWHAEFGA